MSLITYPVATAPRTFLPSSFTARSQINQRAFASPFGGSEQAVDMLNDRWQFSLDLPPCKQTEAAQREAFINALRGQVNHTNLHHFGRPAPQGTLSGSPTAQAAAQGAATLVLNAPTGQTLKAGDMIGVAGLLLQVAADCVSVASVLTVPLVNRLRVAVTAGSAVTWSMPTAPFRLVSATAPRYVAGYAEGMTLDFVEKVD